jgi:hypothetical protein
VSDCNQPGLQFCSACTGDYEDPAFSGMPDGEDVASEDEDECDQQLDEEFPA